MEIKFDEASHTYTVGGSKYPSVTQIINDIIPYQYPIADWYLQRGHAVHACAAMIANGVEFDYDGRIAGQVAAIYKFFKEVNPEVLYSEKMVYSKVYRFAGRYDLIAKIQDRFVFVDYKASIDIERIGLQLGGYSIATLPIVTHGVGVAIKEDGNYSMTKIIDLKNYRREFLAMRAVYGIRDRLGYHK